MWGVIAVVNQLAGACVIQGSLLRSLIDSIIAGVACMRPHLVEMCAGASCCADPERCHNVLKQVKVLGGLETPWGVKDL